MKSKETPARKKARIGWLTKNLEKLVTEARVNGRLSREVCETLVQIEAWADQRCREEGAEFLELPYVGNEADKEHEAEERLLVGMRIQLLGALAGEPLCLREFLREAGAWLKLQRSRALRSRVILA